MSDLVGNPEDRFSCVASQLMFFYTFQPSSLIPDNKYFLVRNYYKTLQEDHAVVLIPCTIGGVLICGRFEAFKLNRLRSAVFHAKIMSLIFFLEPIFSVFNL